MIYDHQESKGSTSSARRHGGTSANSVLDINPELEANLVSIAAAAARPASGTHHHHHHNPHHHHDGNLATSIDPQIELEAASHHVQQQPPHHVPQQQQQQQQQTAPQQQHPQPPHHHHHPHHQTQHHHHREPHEQHQQHQHEQQQQHQQLRQALEESANDQGIPTTGPDGQPIDPKKTCPFCARNFSHPGSLGRHLDLKRGTRLHPAAKVDLIRGDVKRRGDAVEIKARRAKRAKLYNSRQDVKERAKARRKQKERCDKARGIAKSRFIDRLGTPQLPPHPSFAFMVLYFLPVSQWPHDPPTQQTYDELNSTLHAVDSEESPSELISKAEVAYEQWRVMNMQTKMDIWAREQRRAAEAAVGSITLYDLGSREHWLNSEEARIVSEMVSDEEGEGETATATASVDDDNTNNTNHHDAHLVHDAAQHEHPPKHEHDEEITAVAAAVAAASNHTHTRSTGDDDAAAVAAAAAINANIDEQLFN